MSEERFDRLESQLSQVIEGMGTMQQNMTAMQRNFEDKQNLMLQIMTSGFAALNQRVDNIETSLNHLSQQVDDINIDLNFLFASPIRQFSVATRQTT